MLTWFRRLMLAMALVGAVTMIETSPARATANGLTDYVAMVQPVQYYYGRPYYHRPYYSRYYRRRVSTHARRSMGVVTTTAVTIGRIDVGNGIGKAIERELDEPAVLRHLRR